MTRFARATGSKASNVRTPEDSTPWEVMKEQIVNSKKENEDSKKREEAEKQRIENYNNFLKERKTEKRKATWCEFPETVSIKKPNNVSPPEPQVPDKKKKNQGHNTEGHVINDNSKIKPNNIGKNKKQKKNKQLSEIDSDTQKDSNAEFVQLKVNDINSGKNIHSPEMKKTKKKKKNKDKIDTNAASSDTPQENLPVENKKKNAKNLQEKIVSDETLTNKINNESNKKGSDFFPKQNKAKKLHDKPTRRKAINDKSFEFIINGKKVELMRCDGFPVMKKDAERLEELRKNMIKKGIPKSEVQRTIKLERRRAEKALARLKREVCYNCRKGGHNLSDCPDLKSNNIPGKEVADGICFKCGSTEHRQFECKVQRDNEFRFASCFICKETGHIARQCPDNPKGLYPNGGSCKLCGDVTHLRKDCPTVSDKKEESSFKLQTLNANDVESIGHQTTQPAQEIQRKPKKIKF